MGAFEKVFLEKNDNLGYRTIILIPTKLLMFGQKPFFTIETDAQLQEITDHLQQQDIIAVDLEANSLFAFRERISLIQVSTYDNDYVIDPLSISDMEPLLWVLRNPKIRKVMHGSDFDIVSFKRDYNTGIVNLFDTLVAARFLRYSGLGLAALIGKHFGFIIDKKYQKHNWAQRPLYQEHLDYARGDTHWLLALYDIMTVSLKKIDLLTASFEESELLTKKEWNGKGKSEDPYVRLKGFRGLELLDKKKVRLIWELREKIAEKRDVPSFRIFSNHSIIALANADPDSPEYSKILGHSALGKDRKRLRDCICSAEEDERIFEKRKPTPRPQSGPYTERVLSALRLWRNEKVERENIDPVIVFSNGQLKDIARAIPRNKEDLMNIDGIRKWQCQLYTLEILRLVDDALPNKAKNKTVT
jgi:ribonuclease D